MPTALLTTKPARVEGSISPGSCGSVAPLVRRWTTRSGRPARRPRRTALAKSSRRLSRLSGDSTTSRSARQLRGEFGAALATTVREDGAAGTGTHPETEAVGLGTTAVVRLEGALAHSGAPENKSFRRDIAWLSPCAHEGKLACSPEWHRKTITTSDLRPSVGRRQQPSTTRPRYGTRGYAIRSNRADGAPHCAQAVDNDLNRTRWPDYRCLTPDFLSRPSQRTTHSWDPL